MRIPLVLPALAMALLGGLAPAARAGLILQPAAATSHMGAGGGTSPDNVRNQSGLSVGYTSLVTDFDAYIASGPTHDDRRSTVWQTDLFTTTGDFDFSLGGTFTIQSFALWNRGADHPANVRGFELLADDNAAFTSPTLLGAFDADPNTGPTDAVGAEVFEFTPTSAAFVRLRITSNHGSLSTTAFGEAAFEVQSVPVPEPSSLTLVGMGALSLAGYGWRRRRSAGQAQT